MVILRLTKGNDRINTTSVSRKKDNKVTVVDSMNGKYNITEELNDVVVSVNFKQTSMLI